MTGVSRTGSTRRQRDALLRLIAIAVDGEMAWQDVLDLQAFLRDGVVELGTDA